jgi:hypothetical protein
MGCNCNKRATAEQLVDLNPKSWGPTYWNVLHTLAELSGKKGSINNEEGYLWDYILREMPDIIPCIECQKHYREYYTANPPRFVLSSLAEERRNKLREWLYTLHSNTPRYSETPVPTLEEMPDKYSLAQVNLSEEMKKMYGFYNAGVTQGILNGIKIFTYKSKIDLLRLVLT